MPSQGGENASVFWRQFEELSLRLVRDQFNIEPNFVLLTPPTADGGFDGVVRCTISDSTKLGLDLNILLEAKLRSRSKSLGLRSFAASLIVAYNRAADILVIVCNQSFSPQAINEARDFTRVTRMKIKLVDGAAVAKWVRPRIQELEQRFSDTFVTWLLSSCDSADSVQASSNGPICADNSSSSASPMTNVIEIGENAVGTYCNITFERADRLRRNATTIYGTRRREFSVQLGRLLANHAQGIIIVEGAAGFGKSLLISNALYIVGEKKTYSSINLSTCFSVRQLFLAVFSSLTGIEASSLADTQNVASLARLLTAVSDSNTPSEDATAAAAAFFENGMVPENSRPHSQFLLTEFLRTMAEKHARQAPFILSFENLNTATSEMLDFLLASILKIQHSGLILIELRTDGDATFASPSDWQSFQKLFQRSATNACAVIPNFESEDCFRLIEEILPNFDREQAKAILRRVGHSPLHLELACRWLKDEGIVRETGTHICTIGDIDRFFEGISPDRTVTLLQHLISFWMDHPDRFYATALMTASLLRTGPARPLLARLLPMPPDSLSDDRLIRTGIFRPPENHDRYPQVRHDLLAEQLAQLPEKFPALAHDIATALLGDGVALEQYVEDARSARARLLFAARQWGDAFAVAKQYAAALRLENQLSRASDLWRLAYEACRHIDEDSTDRDATIAETLASLLEVENERNRIQLPLNQGVLAALETHVATSASLRKDLDWHFRVQLLRWRRYFFLESFEPALEISQHLYETAQSDVRVSERAAATSCVAVALTLKGVGSHGDARAVFEEGIRKYAHLASFQHEYHAHVGVCNLTKNPATSLDCYLQMRCDEKANPSLSLSRGLHTDVDIAMALLHLRQYEEAKRKAEAVSYLALSNGVGAQESRARNISACCDWIAGETARASRQFNMAILAAERSYFYRFLWRIRTNAAALHFELGDHESASANAIKAFELITKPRVGKNGQFKELSDRFSERWYLALLVVSKILQRLDLLSPYREVTRKLPYFTQDIELLGQHDKLQLILRANSHLHSHRILITG